jgi:DNA-binding transcriptional ArsR family regulator
MANLDATFSALSDPTRRAILSRLALGEATVMELSEPFSMSQPAISRHLRVLEQAGLIARRIEGAKRPCRLVPKGIDPIEQWIGMLRRTLETNYARLDKVLAEQANKRKDSRRRWAK